MKMKPDTKPMGTHIEIKIKMLRMEMGMGMQMQMARNLEISGGDRSLPLRGERRVRPYADFAFCLEPTLRDVATGLLTSVATDCAFSVGTAVSRAVRDRAVVINFLLLSVVCRPPRPLPCNFVE